MLIGDVARRARVIAKIIQLERTEKYQAPTDFARQVQSNRMNPPDFS